MYIAIVTYRPANGKSAQEITESFHAAAPMFQNVPGLEKKYFCFDEDGYEGTSIYIWQDRRSADLFFTAPAFMESFTHAFGCEPDIRYVEPTLIVEGLTD